MNVVDSCGWLEFMANGANAPFFAPALLNEKELVIPSVVIFEVCKRLTVLAQAPALDAFLSVVERCNVVHLNHVEMASAAKAGIERKLALADAIIWQTAQSHHATLYTQDTDLKGLPGVLFKAKSPVSLPKKSTK